MIHQFDSLTISQPLKTQERSLGEERHVNITDLRTLLIVISPAMFLFSFANRQSEWQKPYNSLVNRICLDRICY